MCEKCIARHKEAMVMANEHMDALQVPEDSIARGLADVEIACMAHPYLAFLVEEMWPVPSALMQ